MDQWTTNRCFLHSLLVEIHSKLVGNICVLKMSGDASFWSRLEESSQKKYPDYVKEPLLKCGYDSSESLLMICIESITDMEEYLKTKFMPAHKDYILDIPDQIEKMEQVKKPQSKSQKKNDSDSSSSRRRKKIDDKKIKCKSNTPSQGFRSTLVDKVKKYIRSNDLDDESISVDDIIAFKRSANEKYLYECHLKCPFCKKTCSVKCNLNKSWDTKNLYSHMSKYHKKDKSGGNSPGISSTESGTAYTTPKIQRVYSMHLAAGPSSTM